MYRNTFLFLCLSFVLGSPAFSLGEQGLKSNLEVSQPSQGTWGLTFAATNNNLGNNFWVDPVSNSLTSYSQVGLGGRYYIDSKMRISAVLESFANSWTYSNKDIQSLFGAAIKSELDFILISSGPVDFYTGPMLEIAFAAGSYTSQSNSVTTNVSGQTYTAGINLGAEYFPHAQFSIGASSPVTYRLVSTTTSNSNALVGPTQSGLFVLGTIVVDLTYYF